MKLELKSFRGGLNTWLPEWSEELRAKNQCVSMQNLRHKNEFMESIPGTQKYHITSLGEKVTAIMPYYNDQTDYYHLLAACGDSIFKRDESLNEFTAIKTGLQPNSIFTHTMRYDVMYIASTGDNMMKYLGGNQIETVGTGSTAPGKFMFVIYMKEIDRLFGISYDAIFGQISWCNLSDPETWDGANVERIKLKDGEIVEGASILYGKLIIHCTYSTWIYYVSGNEENWKLEEAPTSVGCCAPRSIKRVGNEIWYLGEGVGYQLGIYAFNGSTSRLLTRDIQPTMGRLNKFKIRNACAEVHDDLYTISFALDASLTNNASIDLDIINLKEDGTPAIYGIHTVAFFSSAVLNNRQKAKEWLLGDESDGFIYQERGTTLKSSDGVNGQLLEARFKTPVYSQFDEEDSMEMIKRFKTCNIFFMPRGYFDCQVKYYFSQAGTNQDSSLFNPNAQTVGFAGDFNLFEDRVFGTPNLYQYQQRLGLSARGVSMQIEIINDNKASRLGIQGMSIEADKLYETRKAVSYAV